MGLLTFLASISGTATFKYIGFEWQLIPVIIPLFIFHHIFNMSYSGFSAMFCLDVFLLGVLFCLLVWTEGNFWIASGIHTGWNYLQSYIFSIEASGNPATVGAFHGTLNHADGFFHESYGYEGSVTAMILVTASILWLICRLNKNGGE